MLTYDRRAFRTVFLVVFVPWLILLGALIIFFASFPSQEGFYDREHSYGHDDNDGPGTAFETEADAYATWVLVLGVPFAAASLALVLVCAAWFVSWAHFQPY